MAIRHGLKTNLIRESNRITSSASSSVALLITTAHDADEDYYPANTLVLVDNYSTAIAKAGTLGHLPKALNALYKQCKPAVIVLRIPDTLAEPATDAEIIGGIDNDGVFTGMQLIEICEQQLGIKPDYVGAPGLEGTLVINELNRLAKLVDAGSYWRIPAATATAAMTFKTGLSGSGPGFGHWGQFTEFGIYTAAVAIGRRCRADMEYGKHKTISNLPIEGVSGIVEQITFDSTGDTGMAKTLNDAYITTLVRNNNSYCFWGNRSTTGGDSVGDFESGILMDYKIKRLVNEKLAWITDMPISVARIKLAMSQIEGILAGLANPTKEEILGYSVWFAGDLNSATDLGNGIYAIDYDYTVPSPAESGTLNQRRSNKYYLKFSDSVATA